MNFQICCKHFSTKVIAIDRTAMAIPRGSLTVDGSFFFGTEASYLHLLHATINNILSMKAVSITQFFFFFEFEGDFVGDVLARSDFRLRCDSSRSFLRAIRGEFLVAAMFLSMTRCFSRTFSRFGSEAGRVRYSAGVRLIRSQAFFLSLSLV